MKCFLLSCHLNKNNEMIFIGKIFDNNDQLWHVCRWIWKSPTRRILLKMNKKDTEIILQKLMTIMQTTILLVATKFYDATLTEDQHWVDCYVTQVDHSKWLKSIGCVNEILDYQGLLESLCNNFCIRKKFKFPWWYECKVGQLKKDRPSFAESKMIILDIESKFDYVGYLDDGEESISMLPTNPFGFPTIPPLTLISIFMTPPLFINLRETKSATTVDVNDNSTSEKTTTTKKETQLQLFIHFCQIENVENKETKFQKNYVLSNDYGKMPMKENIPYAEDKKAFPCKLVFCPNETSFWKSVHDIIMQCNPDLILGYRNEDWWENLSCRMKQLKLKLHRSIDNNDPSSIAGRFSFDIYKIYQQTRGEEKSYDLLDLMRKEKIGGFSGVQEVDLLIEACKIPVNSFAQAITDLFIRSDFLLLSMHMAWISYAPWQNVISFQHILVAEAMILLEAEMQNCILHPTDNVWFKRDFQQRQEALSGKSLSGGLILEPDIGIHRELALLLDFQSMYPSIIVEFNIDFPKTKILFTIENRLLKERIDIKQLIRENESKLPPAELKSLTVLQNTLKKMANLLYGVLFNTTFRFHSAELANVITQKGRELLERTKTLVQTKFPCKVLLGDTDSLLIQRREGETKENIENMAKIICQQVNSQYRFIVLKVDGLFRSNLICGKKKYAAITNEGKLIVKGLPCRMKTFHKLCRREFKQLLRNILTNGDASIADDMMHQMIIDSKSNYDRLYRTMHFSPRFFQITVVLHHQLSHYQKQPNAQSIPFIRAVCALYRFGYQTKIGNQIQYCMAKGGHDLYVRIPFSDDFVCENFETDAVSISSPFLAQTEFDENFYIQEQFSKLVDKYLLQKIFPTVVISPSPLPDSLDLHSLVFTFPPSSADQESALTPPMSTTYYVCTVCGTCYPYIVTVCQTWGCGNVHFTRRQTQEELLNRLNWLKFLKSKYMERKQQQPITPFSFKMPKTLKFAFK